MDTDETLSASIAKFKRLATSLVKSITRKLKQKDCAIRFENLRKEADACSDMADKLSIQLELREDRNGNNQLVPK